MNEPHSYGLPERDRPGRRAEGSLRVTDQLLERSSREYVQVLLDRIQEGGDFMYVYMLSSISGSIYIGVTNDLCQRIFEHKQKVNKGFSSKYTCTNLVYFEIHLDPGEANDREKQIKNWRREKKHRLIRTLNPGWIDLSQFLPSIEMSRLSGAIPRLPSVAREDWKRRALDNRG